jgi:iron complex outermembrane receptor protein
MLRLSCTAVIAFLWVAVAIPRAAGAQQPDSRALNDASSRQSGQEGTDTSDPFHVRATVVVTATRSETEVDKTPLSATVVTAQDIEARPVQSLDQHLTLTEGVYVQRFQGFSATDSNVYLRGFRGASRTLVLLDGLPVNDAFADSVNWTGLPTGQVQSIEVARGPFSSLYGGNALGGVINIRTRPIDRRALHVGGEYGTYDSHRVTALYSDRFMSRFGILAGAERFETDGYNSRRFTATPGTGTGTLVTGAIPSLTTAGARTAIIGEGGLNWLTRHAERVKGELQTSESSLFWLQYLRTAYSYGYTGYRSYLRDASGNVIDSGAVVFDDGGTQRRLSVTPNNFLQGPGEQYSHFYSGLYQHAVSDASTLRVDAGVYQIPSFQFRQLGTGNTLTSGPGTLTEGRRRTVHANVQYNRTVQRHTVTIGGETRQQYAAHSRIALSNWTNEESRGNQTFFATGRSMNQSAYVQDQITIANTVLLVLGARYDYWRGHDGLSDNYSPLGPRTEYPARARNQLSGKAALGYMLPGEWNLRVSAGNAFRNPNVFDLYAPDITSSGVIFAPNPSLTPETVVSWETGVRKRFGARTSVDAAYYENHIEDLIYRQTDLARDPTGNFRINMNAGGGRTRGVELAVRQDIVPGLQFRTTYTFTDAVITSNPADPAIVGKRVTNSPAHMASAQLIGGRGRWTGSLAGHYTGKLFSTDTNTDTIKGVPGSYSPFFVMDAGLSYALSSRVQPFISSENLLNRRYYMFYLSPGRTVFGGMRVRL